MGIGETDAADLIAYLRDQTSRVSVSTQDGAEPKQGVQGARKADMHRDAINHGAMHPDGTPPAGNPNP
jgi:hypothetical protein